MKHVWALISGLDVAWVPMAVAHIINTAWDLTVHWSNEPLLVLWVPMVLLPKQCGRRSARCLTAVLHLCNLGVAARASTMLFQATVQRWSNGFELCSYITQLSLSECCKLLLLPLKFKILFLETSIYLTLGIHVIHEAFGNEFERDQFLSRWPGAPRSSAEQ